MVDVGQDDMLGYGDLYREREELKEKCETLERENSVVKKELAKLQGKAEVTDSL